MKADLIVRRFGSDREVSRVTVNNPFGSIHGQEKYEVVMMGMLINMSDKFYIDDTEIDKARNDST